MTEKIEFIESYIKSGYGDYQWNDNRGELIRCKDCKYCEAKPDKIRNITFYVCTMHSMDTEYEAYCSWAERKEE